MLEKKLAEKVAEKKQESRQTSQAVQSNPNSPSQATSVQATSVHEAGEYTPRSSHTTPESPMEGDDRRRSVEGKRQGKDKDNEEVEALSEMMCSLVTNTSGETRYIGRSNLSTCRVWLYLTVQALHLASPSSRPWVFSGSTRGQEISHSSL